MVKAIAEGYLSITPYLVVSIAGLQYISISVHFPRETYRHRIPDGKSIINAKLKIGDSIALLSDKFRHGCCLSC
jgi:hypothetical protein